MKTTLITASTKSPLLLNEIKDHLRIERGETVEDDYLKMLRDAALDLTESITNRKLMTQTWDVYFDSWPSGEYLNIPYAPLQSIASTNGLIYTDSTGNSTTFNLTGSTTSWTADTISEPGRIVLDNGEDWPSDVLHQYNPIKVRFVCGYTASSNIPQGIKQAMLLMIGHWYENREETIAGQDLNVIPKASAALLAPHRVYSF